MSLILASSSLRRKIILESLGFEVEVQPLFDVDETPPIGAHVREQVRQICQRKAEAWSSNDVDLVIVSDTMIEHPENPCISIGKPNDELEARSMLELLSGRRHNVCTTTKIFVDGAWEEFSNISTVEFSELSSHELNDLIVSQSWVGKAGAYDLHGDMGQFATVIEGGEYTVLGLAKDAVEFLIHQRS